MSSFKSQISDFHLEDKVSFAEGGIVRPPIIHTYQRKCKKGNAELVGKEGS